MLGHWDFRFYCRTSMRHLVLLTRRMLEARSARSPRAIHTWIQNGSQNIQIIAQMTHTRCGGEKAATAAAIKKGWWAGGLVGRGWGGILYIYIYILNVPFASGRLQRCVLSWRLSSSCLLVPAAPGTDSLSNPD